MYVVRRPTQIKAGPVDLVNCVVGDTGLVLWRLLGVRFVNDISAADDLDEVDVFGLSFMTLFLLSSLELSPFTKAGRITQAGAMIESIGQ
jgi:hypothetical protein